MTSDEGFACPACGFLAFSEAPGSYEICDVCGWEDDHVQLANPTMGGGANRESLMEAQQTALRDVPLEVRRREEVERDPAWRPLETSDLESDSSGPGTGIEYFGAAAEDSPRYYWQLRPARSVEEIVKEVDQRAVGKDSFCLWIPERLSIKASEVPSDVGMVVVLNRLLHHGLFPDGFEEVRGGRVYRYRREAP